MDNKYIKYLMVSFPLIIFIGFVAYIILNYKKDALNMRLMAMQVKQLENQLGIKSSPQVVDDALAGDFIEKATSKLPL